MGQEWAGHVIPHLVCCDFPVGVLLEQGEVLVPERAYAHTLNLNQIVLSVQFHMAVSVPDNVVVFIVEWNLLVVHLLGVALRATGLAVPDILTLCAVPLSLKKSDVFKPPLPLTVDAIALLKYVEGLEWLGLLRVGLLVAHHTVGRLAYAPVTLADFAGMEVLSVPVQVLLLILPQEMWM